MFFMIYRTLSHFDLKRNIFRLSLLLGSLLIKAKFYLFINNLVSTSTDVRVNNPVINQDFIHDDSAYESILYVENNNNNENKANIFQQVRIATEINLCSLILH